MCRCAVIGDPMVIFYDKDGTALLQNTDSYVLSFAPPNRHGYQCGFGVIVTNYKPHNDSQLVVPKGVQIIINGGTTSSTFMSKFGIWNYFVADQWVAYPTNYSDGIIRMTGDIDVGFTLIPEDVTCKLRFYAKFADELSVMAAFVDKAQYGQYLSGICGNCNDVADDYDRLPNAGSLDDVLRIVTPNFIRTSSGFPPGPTV